MIKASKKTTAQAFTESHGTSGFGGFITALKHSAFTGDVHTDLASKLVGATDNSIYRLQPQALVYPKTTADLQILARTAHAHKQPLTARGGGTGTNGQSLSESVIVDTSRHMTAILGFDPQHKTVTVQPGVVLDQLNEYLSGLGYFFPPAVSTSSRATIGGMFATDASGKGSRLYGRTSDYVQHAELIMADGCLSFAAPNRANSDPELIKRLSGFENALNQSRAEVQAVFPVMNRGLTGYNLLDAAPKTGALNLIKLLAGSEGTLALSGDLTLSVKAVPRAKALTVIAYNSSLQALAHIPYLLACEPLAIEFIDDRILTLAAQTPMWPKLASIFGATENAKGFLFVEFVGKSVEQTQKQQAALETLLAQKSGGHSAVVHANLPEQQAALWGMRKQAVGLLAAIKGKRVGIPFIEDAAVPPENLVRFVTEFRALLDAHKLEYGMFGHADVGCLHVRPVLDMRDKNDRALIRVLSDAVSRLCQKHGGLIWGEHGKGVRGEYIQSYVGDHLYGVMAQLKTAFDPNNLLNPGKLVSPTTQPTALLKIDSTPFRGEFDQHISDDYQAYAKSVACNGNGACFHWSPKNAMCPSYKATRDKVQAPKGRATLFREWTIARSTQPALGHADSEQNEARIKTIETALLSSLSSCLSCKSCTGQCPVQIDVPEMKARFLHEYFKRHRRTLRDRLVRFMERASLLAMRTPRLANALQNNAATRALMRGVFHLVDVPSYQTPGWNYEAKRLGIKAISTHASYGKNTVVLILDSFTTPFEHSLISAHYRLLTLLGFNVLVSSVLANGKALHVRGYLPEFKSVMTNTLNELAALAATGARLLSIEPAVTEHLRSEAKQHGKNLAIHSIDQLLAENTDTLKAYKRTDNSEHYSLLLHCTEKTADPATESRWRTVFSALDLQLEIPETGCCGMSGLFGHEAEHQEMSRELFDLSWQQPVDNTQTQVLATGFSCRSQTKRFSNSKAAHPVEALLGIIKEPGQAK